MCDFDNLKTHLVDLSHPSSNPIVSGFDSEVLDSLIFDEFTELKQNGLTKFCTESGYTGVIFTIDKADEAKAMILEIITEHAKKVISDHETTILHLRKYHATFNNID